MQRKNLPAMSSRLLSAAVSAGFDLSRAVHLLRAGGVVIFPTETLYGLGCIATNADAVARVYQLKRRPVHKPLPLLAADTAQVSAVADLEGMPPGLYAFWPGPLTVLLPGRQSLPSVLKDAHGRVAVRVTSHPLAAALALQAGGTLTASSANRSGLPAVRRAGELDPSLLSALAACCDGIMANLVQHDTGAAELTIPILTDGPQPAGGLPSTIVEPLHDAAGRRVRVLRDGAISAAQLTAAGFVLA